MNTHRDIRSGSCFEGIKLKIQCHECDKTRCGCSKRPAVNMGTSEEQAEWSGVGLMRTLRKNSIIRQVQRTSKNLKIEDSRKRYEGLIANKRAECENREEETSENSVRQKEVKTVSREISSTVKRR